jgi:hypothetical protein
MTVNEIEVFVDAAVTISKPGILFIDATTQKSFLTIELDPPNVEVDPDLDWNQAAKQFWNAVYRMIGKPALFPD